MRSDREEREEDADGGGTGNDQGQFAWITVVQVRGANSPERGHTARSEEGGNVFGFLERHRSCQQRIGVGLLQSNGQQVAAGLQPVRHGGLACHPLAAAAGAQHENLAG